MLRFIPRNGSIRKWKESRKEAAVRKGVASVAKPYRSPGHSFNLYETHANFAGRWPFAVREVHFSTLSAIFSSWEPSSPEGLDHTPNVFSQWWTSYCWMGSSITSRSGKIQSLEHMLSYYGRWCSCMVDYEAIRGRFCVLLFVSVKTFVAIFWVCCDFFNRMVNIVLPPLVR